MPTPAGHTRAIRASRVMGTSVYNTAGEKIGALEDVMLDKGSNNVMFDIVGFGGFLGMGEKFHPIPRSALDYSADRGGYVVPFTKDQLKAAPANTIEELSANDGLNTRDAAFSYYKVVKYW